MFRGRGSRTLSLPMAMTTLKLSKRESRMCPATDREKVMKVGQCRSARSLVRVAIGLFSHWSGSMLNQAVNP